MDLYAPFYKGLVHSDNPDTEALITKRDPVTGADISDEQYVSLVQRCAVRDTQLVQDISRMCASACLARDGRMQGQNAQLVTVEGCPQTVNGRRMLGAHVMASIHTHVVPRGTKMDVPLRIETESDCTIREARAILAHIPRGGSVQAVTHQYHVRRTQGMLEEEAQPDQRIHAVLTPLQVASGMMMRKRQPEEDFIFDIINAAEPSQEIYRSERRKEALVYGPLHAVSRRLEWVTGGKVNLETYLARKMRK